MFGPFNWVGKWLCIDSDGTIEMRLEDKSKKGQPLLTRTNDIEVLVTADTIYV